MNPDLYVRRDAWMHGLDPRSKLAFVLCFWIAAFVTTHPLPLIALLILTHTLALSTRIPWFRLGQAWRALLPITLLIIVLSSIVIGASDTALLRVGALQVTPTSIAQAAGMAARVDALAFALLLLLWTTEQGELVVGLTRLGLSYGASLTLAIAMQFVPTFGRIFEEILEAQQARGLIIPRGNPFAVGRAYLPVLVPLMITALRTADNLSLALVARGFNGAAPRTSRRQLHMTIRDWCYLLGSLALMGLTLVLRLR